VVFYVAGNENIRSSLGGCPDERRTGTGTIGDAPEGSDAFRGKAGQACAVQADVPGKPGEQFVKGQRIWKVAHATEAPERISSLPAT
jgi:hypothetical protein